MSFIKGDPNKNLIPVFAPSNEQKDVVVTAGVGIGVTDSSDADAFRFEVYASAYTALAASLTLVAKVSSVVQSIPILKGVVVDEVEFTISYNKTIAAQTLTNNGGITAPTLALDDVFFEYTGQAISSNITFTLQGNDGQSQPGSIASDAESITFGNYMWIGDGATKIGTATSGIEAFLESLTSSLKTSRTHTYYATGGSNEKHFVAYPKTWGLATFKKGIFEGGYVRLKNVGGTLVTDIGEGSETDVSITNSAGHSEAYYIYESLYDAQEDAVTPFNIL